MLVLADLDLSSHKPELTMLVNGNPVMFLVDSGAERTVLKDIEGIPESNKKVRILAANGRLTLNSVSKMLTLKLRDEDSDEDAVQLTAIMAPDCPHNLLGRDAILALKLTITVGPDGRLAVFPPAVPTYVVAGPGLPHYYWSLDFPTKDITGIASQLKELAFKNISDPTRADVMLPTEYHMTLRFKWQPGPDPLYDKKVHKLKPQQVTLTHLYFKGNLSYSDLDISAEAQQLMLNPSSRHVSLTKTDREKWRDLGAFARLNRAATDFKPTGGKMNEQYSTSTKWTRISLCWRITLTPTTHITDT